MRVASDISVPHRLAQRSALSIPVADTDKKIQWGFPEIFIISQTALPAILFLPGTQGLRLPLRVAVYAMSLAGLMWLFGRRDHIKPHPAVHWLFLALACLILMIFHPTTNTILAGLAQTMLYLSVLAPVFWAPHMVKTPQRLMRLLVILFICNGVNSVVGVLQFYSPDTFMPQEFSNVVMTQKYGLSNYTYVDSMGKLAIRPPGLFDTPGTVCAAGMFAALLGFVFAVNMKKLSHRLGALILGGAGVAAVYLSQVRSALLIMGGMMAVYIGILWVIQKQRKRAILLLGIATVIVTLLFSFTVARTGTASLRRLQALTASDPLTVYSKHRGNQLENAFSTLVPQYPLGAGLGRWGMMRVYFGDELNSDSPRIWAELQFPAWILDGGIVLAFLYSLALLVTALYELKISKAANSPSLRLVTPTIVAANMGVIALVLGFTPFTSQFGMQYWFLAGALHGVVRSSGLFTNEPIRTGKRRLQHLGRNGSRKL